MQDKEEPEWKKYKFRAQAFCPLRNMMCDHVEAFTERTCAFAAQVLYEEGSEYLCALSLIVGDFLKRRKYKFSKPFNVSVGSFIFVLPEEDVDEYLGIIRRERLKVV